MGVDRRKYGAPREAQGTGGGGRDDAELWDYRSEWPPGEMREVIFDHTREPSGAMKSAMHYFTDGISGEAVKMWGCTVLTDKLTEAVEGDLLEITYKGKADPTGPGNPYHDFAITVFPAGEGDGPGPAREPAPSQGQRRQAQAAAPRNAPAPRSREPERAPPPEDDDGIPF